MALERRRQQKKRKFNNTDNPQNEEEKMFDTGPQNEEGDNENKKLNYKDKQQV